MSRQSPGDVRRVTGALVALVCLLFADSARAGVEATRATGWTAWRWSAEDGLPLDDVTALDFGPGGLAWIATFDGLARFDGTTFDLHRPASHPGLPTARIVDLAVDGDVRWLVTETGDLVRGDRSGYDVIPPDAHGVHPAHDLARLGGQLWVIGSGGIARLDPAGPQPVSLPDLPRPIAIRDGVPTAHGEFLLALQDGALASVDPALGAARVVLPGADPGSGRVHPDSWRSQEGAAELQPRAHAVIDGEALIVRGDALHLLDASGSSRPLDVPAGGVRLLVGVDGALRVLGADRVWRWANGALVPDDGPLPVPPDRWWIWDRTLYHGQTPVFVGGTRLALLQVDAGGGAWVAESGAGLLHVRSSAVTSLQEDEHGPIGPVNAVAAEPGGALWIAADAGVRRWDAGRRQLVVDAEGQPVHDGLSLLVARDGTVQVSGRNGFCTVHQVPPDGPIPCVEGHPDDRRRADIVLREGPDGSVWSGSGVLLRQQGRALPEVAVQQEGWKPFRDIAFLPDGSVLGASVGAGLWRVADGVPELRAGEPGSPIRAVRVLLVDDRGDVWLGTEGLGLCRLQLSGGVPFADAPLHCVGPRDGLADPFVNSLASDGQGRLWMSSNRGLHVVPWDALREHVEGRLRILPMRSFGRPDGMVEPETNGVRKPSVTATPDGALWYPTMNGVVRLDPAAVGVSEPPPVVIDALASPGRSLLESPHGVVLGPEERELGVRWTAAAFHHSDELRFRYRLAGLDSGWRGPTDVRAATWTTLPPGSYTLEVQSGLGGRWLDPQTVATVRVSPTFRETSLFWVLMAVLAVAAGGGLAWMRGRRLRARAQELELAVDVATAKVAAQAERLEQLDQVRTRFVANISHELRTPITLILGTLAGSTEDAPERLKASLGVALRNAERLAELVEQLLDVARLDAGGVPLRARRVELGAWLSRVVERFAAVAESRAVALSLERSDDVAAWIDRDLLEKVVTNLLGNGLDHCPDGGRLTVALTTEGDDDVGQAVIRVSDTGPGVPEHLRERLFDRFFQVDDGDQRPRGGAGIGLSLTREFVELHGGTVDVEPTDGPGATFRVRIPLGSAHLSITEVQLATDEELTPVPVPTTVNDEDRSSPDLPLALVVEDHPDMRAFVADQLAAAFSVVTAVDGRDALDQLEAGLSPKVVVSDVMMPRLDGLGLCRALRADPRWAALPLLLLSAKATEDDTLAGLDVADDYLTKPFRSAELVLRARKLAGRPQEELSAQSSNPFVEKIEALVEEHMADARLGAAQLAKLAGLSPRQFQRRLKEEVGESPAAWVRGRRLLAARDLMQRGSVETVGEAAAAVGMNRSYLARVYQAWAGHPPSEDLRRNRTQV